MLKDIAAKTKVRKYDRTTRTVNDCIGIVSLRPVIGLETRHSFSQSDTKLKPIVTFSFVFPALQVDYVISTFCFHWLYVMFFLL